MPRPANSRFASDALRQLIERLQRIQRRDEMTQEDCDHALLGAAVLNWEFLRLEGAKKKTRKEIKRLLWNRVLDVMEAIDKVA